MNVKLIKSVTLLLGILVGISFAEIRHAITDNAPQQTVDYRLTAPRLYAEYQHNEHSSNRKYWDAIIEVEGIVQEVYENSDGTLYVLLQGHSPHYGVSCEIPEPARQIKQPLRIGSTLRLQGRCYGMDANVRMTQCNIVE